MPAMIEVFRSAVNIWDCDDMGHMNVRFYVARFIDGLASFGHTFGMGPRQLATQQQSLQVQDQLIRYHRELRMRTPYFIRAGLVAADSSGIKVYQELVNALTEQVAATFVIDVVLVDSLSRQQQAFPAQALAQCTDLVSLPDYGQPRGTSTAAPRPSPTIAEAEQLAMAPIYHGVVHHDQVDSQGFMQLYHFMGAISNGITNLFLVLDDKNPSRDEGIGGAALEYRFIYKQLPKSGDLLAIYSGLQDITGKASKYVHWMFNTETGDCVASSEAIVVSFDLTLRKAVAISPENRQRLMAKAIPSLHL